LGFRLRGSGFVVWIQGLGFKDQNFGLGIQGLGFIVCGLGFRGKGSKGLLFSGYCLGFKS
jgi:hypothetical protein